MPWIVAAQFEALQSLRYTAPIPRKSFGEGRIDMKHLCSAVWLFLALVTTASAVGQTPSNQFDPRTVATADGGTPSLPYLYQKLGDSKYKMTFRALFAASRGVPEWVQHFITTLDGVQAPGESVTFDGKLFELYKICQPHNCSGNYLYVLFAPGGGLAWAITTKDGANFRFYGNPGEAMQKFLIGTTNRF